MDRYILTLSEADLHAISYALDCAATEAEALPMPTAAKVYRSVGKKITDQHHAQRKVYERQTIAVWEKGKNNAPKSSA